MLLCGAEILYAYMCPSLILQEAKKKKIKSNPVHGHGDVVDNTIHKSPRHIQVTCQVMANDDTYPHVQVTSAIHAGIVNQRMGVSHVCHAV